MDRASIEAALIELDALTADSNATENQFQKWFETHSVIFEVLGYKTVSSCPFCARGYGLRVGGNSQCGNRAEIE